MSDRRGTEERPPAPWGSFPLAELTVLGGIVMLIVGVVSKSPTSIGVGVVLAGLGGLATARVALKRQGELETSNRELLRRMLAKPAEHKWLRISRADVGEPGCGHWHSRPRLGPLGMLMGWWRVKVSSGCPLSARLAAVER